MCMHACVMGSQWKPFDPESNTVSYLDGVAYRVLLKVHTTGLATDKNTSLLGMLDQIEIEM